MGAMVAATTELGVPRRGRPLRRGSCPSYGPVSLLSDEPADQTEDIRRGDPTAAPPLSCNLAPSVPYFNPSPSHSPPVPLRLGERCHRSARACLCYVPRKGGRVLTGAQERLGVSFRHSVTASSEGLTNRVSEGGALCVHPSRRRVRKRLCWIEILLEPWRSLTIVCMRSLCNAIRSPTRPVQEVYNQTSRQHRLSSS